MESKIIQTITEYNDILKTEEPTNKNMFVYNIETLLAQSIISDFGEKSSRKLANIILAITS